LSREHDSALPNLHSGKNNLSIKSKQKSFGDGRRCNRSLVRLRHGGAPVAAARAMPQVFGVCSFRTAGQIILAFRVRA
jgi:hypothetical protein